MNQKNKNGSNSSKQRNIYVNTSSNSKDIQNQGFCSNKIKTAKYNM